MSQPKLGILVPYRDRPEHLAQFLPMMQSFCQEKRYDYQIFILQQVEGKPFNRGKLINIGILEAEKNNCSYVIAHDVDAIPLDTSLNYGPTPTARLIYSPHMDSLGGLVTAFNIETLKKVNGFSNNYWGWGFEDADMNLRFKNCNIEVDKSEVRIRSSVEQNLSDREKTIEMDGYLQLGHVHSFLKEENYLSAADLNLSLAALQDEFNKRSKTKKIFEEFVKRPEIQWESGLSDIQLNVMERHHLNANVLVLTLEI